MILGLLNVAGKGEWKIASVYGSTNMFDKRKLWLDLEKHCTGILPMLIGGDFNCVMSQEEKRGGKRFVLSQGSKDFSNFLIQNDLHDVKTIGPKFTWCNNKIGNARILEKLDRCLINSCALDIIHVAVVKHLSRVASDHCPLLLNVFKPVEFNRIIRYEEVWAYYFGATALVRKIWSKECRGDPASALNVKFKRTLKALYYCSKAKFKNLNSLRDKLKDEISGIQLEESDGELSADKLQVLRFKINELNVTLARLNTWWRQRAKAKWMEEGDCNSSFFHAFANSRRSSNWINHIKTVDGTLSEEEDVIRKTFSDYFRRKWQHRRCSLEGWPSPLETICEREQNLLDADFSREEL
ncbi:uncharacterized protein LOC110104242 [Dendrobium catenatum]|uniref:uncharacterized protein LOC110104242 n=1 Tax=Dendrobium catenatum TaxID=906689 RepID=UPI0009F6914E|nr:uncharacterized protein LOC110104242 [Dendrobium catenatum]